MDRLNKETVLVGVCGCVHMLSCNHYFSSKQC